MKYYVSVTEVLSRIVSVDANSEQEAIDKVGAAYQCEDIVLDSDDYLEDSARVEIEEQETYRNIEEHGYTKYQHID